MPRGPSVYTPAVLARIVEMNANNNSSREIADAIGVPIGSLYSTCYQRGISLRRQNIGRPIRFWLLPPMYEKLYRAGLDRGTSPHVIAKRIIEIVLKDDLFVAVLDDDA